MNSSTIVLHNYNIFSLKTTRIILGTLGVLMLILGGYSIIENGDSYNLPNLFYGLFMTFTSLFVLSEKSPFSPKVKITDDSLLLKSGFWSRSKKLSWRNIQKIDIGSYKVTFHDTTKDFVFKYEADAEVSIQLKKAIRLAAQEKHIPVIGG